MGGDLAVGNQEHVFEITCKSFKNWVAKQRLPTGTEVAIEAVNAACVLTASLSFGLLGHVLITEICRAKSLPLPSPKSPFLSLCGEYKPLAESLIARGILERTRKCAIMLGCRQTISTAMTFVRGKEEDVQSSLVAGFGGGVVLALATGMRGPGVMSVGVICALLNRGMFLAGIEI